MTTIIKFLGQAGLLVEYNGCRLLCDPWFSQTGGFLARWHQYPPNDDPSLINLDDIRKVDYLYISHMHQDHFDRKFLETVRKDVQVILANFTSREMIDAITDLGFEHMILMESGANLELAPGFSMTMYLEPSGYKEDSCIVIETKDTRIFNFNDCHLSEDTLAEISKKNIDVMFSQFSGAMWYPAAYHYDMEHKKELSKNVRVFLTEYFVKKVKSVKPKYIVPCAGPPCFLEDDTFQYNFAENGIFPDQNDIRPVLEDLDSNYGVKSNIMLPGDVVFIDDGGIGGYAPKAVKFYNLNTFDFGKKEELLRQYQERRLPVIKEFLNSIPEPAESIFVEFEKHLRTLINSSSYIASRVGIVVHFNIFRHEVENIFEVDFTEPGYPIRGVPMKTPQYTITLDARYLNMIVNGDLSWEELFLSMRAKAKRDPDIYNVYLFSLLRYGLNPHHIKKVEQLDIRANESKERIVVSDGAKSYEIQRLCPHLGEDLINGKVKDGVITCSRHNWQFDLNNKGKCVFGGNKDLSCRMLERKPMPADEEQSGLA